MARKKMTKKANKAKVTRKSKQSVLTVDQTLKQLPKLFKKEIAALKKQAQKFVAAIKKAEKQKKKASTALNKKGTPTKLKAAQKAFDKINQSIDALTLEANVINEAIFVLSEKQLAFAVLNDITMEKPAKKKKSAAKMKNKVAKKTKSTKQQIESTPTSPSEDSIEENVEETVSTPELEVEFDD